MGDALTEAKLSCSSQQLDKVKESLDKGESLLAERQKHILLADKSEFGWMIIQEYKKNDLADDDEKKIVRAEARSQAMQNAQKARSRFVPVRRDLSANPEQFRCRFQFSNETYSNVRRAVEESNQATFLLCMQ